MEEFDHCQEFMKGFSGYIFRVHFNEVFEYIADYILNEISLSNDYMVDFLKYYSLNIVIVNGVKYRVPQLETAGGVKWNIVSMLSIAKIYTRTRTSVKKISKEISLMDKQILKLFINNLSPVEYDNIYIQEKNALTELLREKNKKLDKCMDSFRISKDEKVKDKLQNEINLIKREISQVRRKIEKLSKNRLAKVLWINI